MAARAFHRHQHREAGPSAAATAGGVLDLAFLQAQCMDDAELAADLLDMFQIQAAQIVADMTRGGPSAALADLAHKLRGSAAAVGAFGVAAAAAEAEAASRDAPAARGLALETLTVAVGRAAAAIQKALANGSGGLF